MGNACFKPQSQRRSPASKLPRKTELLEMNLNRRRSDLIVHSVVSKDFDTHHSMAMKLELGTVTDEQLLAEVARRGLNLHDRITAAFVSEKYEFSKVLGRGASGEVVLVTHKTTQQQYACKVVKQDTMNDMQSISTELEIMKRIRHRHVLCMKELYETPYCVWMMLELVTGGDLWHYTAEHPAYTEAVVSRVIKQLLSGIHYLHSNGIVHRDLKLTNILMSDQSKDCEVKIADFGLSALIRLGEGYDAGGDSGKRKAYKELTDLWGSKHYLAPEVIQRAYGPQADVWATGCVLFELLSGSPAFFKRKGETDDHALYARIIEGDVESHLFRLNTLKVSQEAQDLFEKMLKVNPTKRCSASEALLHPFFALKDKFETNPLNEAQSLLKQRLDKYNEWEEKDRRERQQQEELIPNEEMEETPNPILLPSTDGSNQVVTQAESHKL